MTKNDATVARSFFKYFLLAIVAFSIVTLSFVVLIKLGHVAESEGALTSQLSRMNQFMAYLDNLKPDPVNKPYLFIGSSDVMLGLKTQVLAQALKTPVPMLNLGVVGFHSSTLPLLAEYIEKLQTQTSTKIFKKIWVSFSLVDNQPDDLGGKLADKYEPYLNDVFKKPYSYVSGVSPAILKSYLEKKWVSFIGNILAVRNPDNFHIQGKRMPLINFWQHNFGWSAESWGNVLTNTEQKPEEQKLIDILQGLDENYKIRNLRILQQEISHSHISKKRWKIFFANLKTLENISDEVSVFFLPLSPEVAALDQYYEKMADEMKNYNTEHFKIYQLQKSINFNKEDYYPDLIHLKPSGQKKLADYVAEQLKL